MKITSRKGIFSLLGIVVFMMIIGLTYLSCETTETRGPSDRPQSMGQQRGEKPEMPDFAEAAEKLGITEEALMEAMGDPRQGPPDFAAVAEKLGITEDELIEALGMPENGPPPAGRR